jgi:dihydrofolate synthase / folylpolyglutamate synthase
MAAGKLLGHSAAGKQGEDEGQNLGTEGDAKKNYAETLSYLFGLQRFGIKLGLANITSLLRHLGDPHVGLPSVHIAGSNGKGSTAAFLTSILRRAGYRVGLYTSPHLVDFSERIQVDGAPIPTGRVVQFTERIREAVEKMTRDGELSLPSSPEGSPAGSDPQKATITFFEFTTAMAFLYFRESKVDVAVLETGMGGRLDATNVIDPILCLITTIAPEHQQYLGRTLIQIAREKAGIIKPERPLLTVARQARVLALFRQKCRELRSPFYAWGKDFSAEGRKPQFMHFRGRSHQWPELRLGLAGSHQLINASLALAGVEVLMESGFALQEEHVRKGLAETRWPGRLELVREHPGILLDGAHNPSATRVLRKALQKGFPRHRLILVLGIMADKEIPRMMADLVPLADLVILTRPRMDRAASLEVLGAQAAPFQRPVVEIAGVDQALSGALEEAKGEDLILVTGSLFTVGEARSYLIREGMI